MRRCPLCGEVLPDSPEAVNEHVEEMHGGYLGDEYEGDGE